jgi:amino acid adenylation domain-containing protein/non-ribosomal peptide synthase protein (TIGR01720 family)
LGGHSLLATQVISRLTNIFKREIPLRAIFEAPTAATLASKIVQILNSSIIELESEILPQIKELDAEGNSLAPLSFAQQRLWFLDRLEPGNASFNLPLSIRILGSLDHRALQSSVDFLVKRHESLRTRFITDADGVGKQVTFKESLIQLKTIDLSYFCSEEREDEARKTVQELIGLPFDLSEDSLIRIFIITVSESDHVILILMHHIISDGWSLNVLIQEMLTSYSAFETGRHQIIDNITPLPIQYADYSIWQRKWLAGKRLEDEFTYWKKKLRDLPPLLALPTDRARPAIQSFRGKTTDFEIPTIISDRVKSFSNRMGVTPFMTFMAIFEILLSRYSHQDDFAIGTPIANRQFTELEGLIGFFVNNLVIRSDISGSQNFDQLIENTRETLLGAYSHQNIPFEMLVDRLKVERNMSHSPLFQVVFVMQNNQLGRIEKAEYDFVIQPFQADLQTSKYDLTLSIINSETGFYPSIEYNTDLFDEERIQRMVTHFLCLLEDTLDNPQKKLTQFSLLPDSERDLLLYVWPGTQFKYPNEVNVVDIFESHARENPDQIAVNDRGEEISYRELDTRASFLAKSLMMRGVTANKIVGVLLDKSSTVIISILAILKVGGIYLPLDPNIPKERLEFMIHDCMEWMNADLLTIISTSEMLGKIPENMEVICLDKDWFEKEKVDTKETSFQERHITEFQLAYVIYTSGSTGKPKGVALHHAGLRNMVEAYVSSFPLTTSDRVLQFASLSFDASIMEIFSALGSGASLYITARDVLLNPIDLLQYLRSQKISMAILPPSLLRILPADDLPDLRILISAGENCTNEIARTWSKGRKFINGYGPTETTIGPTFYVVDPLSVPDQGIPIGKTIPNMKAYLLDDELQPVPIGVPGEICISGVGLAKEYLNQPELTEQKFIPNPWDSGTRLYRTGDLGRWLPDGNIEFSGRKDFQVKLRGFRIELGEIETLLENHPHVTQAVVLVREDIQNQKRLVAYVVADNKFSNLSSNQLKDYLKENLPEYMVPSFILILDVFPLSSSGKVDRKALPNPEFFLKQTYQKTSLPQTEEEKVLADVWQTLLGIERVSLEDNFFEMGGDSIMSIQMIARANSAGLRITPRQLFQYPTIGELVKVIGLDEIETEQGLITGTVELTPIQLRFFEMNQSHVDHWNTSMMLTVFSDLDMNVLIHTVEILMREHDILRSNFNKKDDGWSLEIREQIDLSCVSQIDLSATRSDDRKLTIEEKCNFLQSTLDITNGPLFRIVKLHLGENEPSRLIFIFHHLIFDGVSWRIFINDFQMVYNQILSEQEPKVFPKTTSYKRWSEKLIAYAQNQDVIQEYEYWKKLVGKTTFIPVDFEAGTNFFNDADTVMFSLTEEESLSLLRDIPHILVSRVDEVLFSIFINCMLEWIAEQSIIVELLGHGREDVIPGIDLSRTIGWFSTAYPVLIEKDWKNEYQSLVSSIHTQLGMFTHSGFNFGVLRYLCNDIEIRDSLASIPVPEISFNYLGQFDQTGMEPKDNQLLAIPAPEWRGWEQSPEGKRESKLFVIASVTGGQMHWYFSYSKRLHKKDTIEKIADSVHQELTNLIRTYSSRKEK